MAKPTTNKNEQAKTVVPIRSDPKGKTDGASQDGPVPDIDPAIEPLPPELSLRCKWVMPDGYSTESMDSAFKAHLARFTMGITPYGLSSQFFNWWVHLVSSPGKQVQLVEKAARKAARFAITTAQQAQNGQVEPCIMPLEHDKRFSAPQRQNWPYNLIYQNCLLTQQWWYNATNPEIMSGPISEGGANLIRGAENPAEDWERVVSGKPPVGADAYVRGRDVAVTPGKVVYRSRLLELIQYAPQTDAVTSEPILIVPAWIMKYYILDLSPHNSLVCYLAAQMAPWQSVYKLHILSDNDTTFVLTSGGHNVGIVSEPGQVGRSFQMSTTPHEAKYVPPEDWRAQTQLTDGSWRSDRPDRLEHLARQSEPVRVAVVCPVDEPSLVVAANADGGPYLTTPESALPVLMLATDEERVLARRAHDLLASGLRTATTAVEDERGTIARGP
ncbi:poly-beta-hydroxybutyrate polymerase N-terminal domain-containing protein [Aliiroseovarius sediminis]|uniref:poly-beta-hydroxybutyrate polymerase N-terminal domain-containing protein n=1 Tax=Aliiroseovarius sediminis TaxID=2925839 RepID=UPI001F59615F|nr:poly-beta-hydroxybutyrate polymerase N-terminal domain-containing protein [Aliiroseovarius sediminis]MCI2395983.1 poly-beta-hydroxybutyrate polymerase N-terminal domain-containing protein [Aliiroseovarius sediminis]